MGRIWTRHPWGRIGIKCAVMDNQDWEIREHNSKKKTDLLEKSLPIPVLSSGHHHALSLSLSLNLDWTWTWTWPSLHSATAPNNFTINLDVCFCIAHQRPVFPLHRVLENWLTYINFKLTVYTPSIPSRPYSPLIMVIHARNGALTKSMHFWVPFAFT